MPDQPQSRPDPDPNRFRVLAEALTLGVEVGVYLVALSPSLAVLRFGLELPFLALVVLVVGSWVVDAVVFVLVLILLKVLLARKVPSGRFLMTDPKIFPWILADRVNKMMLRSPFRGMINDYGFLRSLYYRGMGARLGSRFLLANRAMIVEPWSVRAGDDVLLGEDAVLTGHKIERETLTLGDIEIGDKVLIGARAIVFPGVKIGDGAMIGANSVVVRGTEIPPGETWHGNPATPVSLWTATPDADSPAPSAESPEVGGSKPTPQ